MQTKKLQIVGSLGSNDALTIDITDTDQGTATGINADTLGGVAADNYVLETELDTYKTEISSDYLLKTETAADSNKSFGYTFDAFKTLMLDTIYPVGSIYTSVIETNPASLFGGTWEQIQDTFLLASGSSYAVYMWKRTA